MFSASDLIDVVSGRGRVRHWLRVGADTPPGEFPPAWKAWFERMGERLGTVTGATADAIIAVLVQRELATPPRRTIELNRWQAFATLWRQQWAPAEADERGVRWFAIALTFLIHLLLLGILFWLASVRFLVTSRPQGEDVVQVEYVGEGTPEEGAGGAPKAVTAQPAKAAAAPPTQPRPVQPVAPAAPAKTAATPATASSPAPSVPTPAPAPEQPLQVSQVPIPSSTFVLPPPTPRALEMPKVQIAEPALQVPIRAIELAKEPAPAAKPQPPQPTPAPVVPAPPAPPAPVVVINPVVPTVPRAAAPSPPVQQPQPPTPPAPSPTPSAPAVATTPASAPAKAPPTTATLSGGAPSAASGSQPARPTAGSGVTTAVKPGARPSVLRNDDWGASARNRPGGDTGKQPGLFNADGSPRLSAGTAQPGGGFPPGSDNWTKDQFDRAGVWLKRKPNDFTPTRFDKVWVPSETLLEEWVRRNVRSVSIPIPGTSKKLQCTVSLLQLGGGCTISDPNMNDQEAEARPPPDIPFKRELQEDQQSLRKPGAP